jgi:hypothetical protein
MDLTRELLLTYQGLNGFDGLCHIRVYEQPGQLPVVIAGALDDNPGTSITNAIEMVAAAVQRSEFADGREFRLIEHYPEGITDRSTPTYSLVHFNHRAIHEQPNDPRNHAGSIVILGDEATVSRGAEIEGDFRDPHWEPIERIEELLGCEVAIWSPGSYTARAVAGEEGERLRGELAKNATNTADGILANLGEDT